MSPDTPRSTDGARVSTLVALLVLLVSALTAGSAAAASGATPDPADGSPVVGTASAGPGSPVASAASSSGFIVSSTPSSAGPSAPVAPAAVRPAPTTIASGSEDGSVGRPSRSAPSPAPARATVDSSVVTTSRPPPPPPTGLAQLHSGGPLVGSARSRAPAARPVLARRPGAAVPTVPRGWRAPPAAAVRVSVSVPMEGVFLSGSTSARRPGQRSVAAVGLPVGPAGLGSVSLGSPWGSPVPGGSTWLGSAPVSSSSSGASGLSLLGLNALLVALTLLGAGSWRRGWVCPGVGVESLVLVSALDRPG